MTAQDPYRPQMQPPPSAQPASHHYGEQQPVYGAPGPAQQHMQPPQPPQQQYFQQPAPYGAPYGHVAPWPGMAVPAPAMIEGFPLWQPRLKPIPSGPAIGSLPAGIGGILGALPGLVSAAFSPWAGLTFFMCAALLGTGAVLLASHALRRIRAAGGGISGRGMAITGLILGLVALSMALLTGVISLATGL